MKRYRLLRRFFSALILLGVNANAEVVVLADAYTRLSIDVDRAAITNWTICYQPCAETENPAYIQQLITDVEPLEFNLTNAGAQEWLLHERGDIFVELARSGSKSSADANKPRLRIELGARYETRIHFDGSPADSTLSIRLRPPSVFDRQGGHGFAAAREFISPLAFQDGKIGTGESLALDEGNKGTPREMAQTTSWVGYRNRFWALMARTGDSQAVWRYAPSSEPGSSSWAVRIEPNTAVTVYAGPVEPAALRIVDPALTQTLFANLWFWLRWLCLGMLWLLNGLESLFGNWGVAIIVLSVIVKIFMTPLTKIAEHWQAGVNRIQNELQPRIDAIKREFKGEEQANRILAAHKEVGVTPFYTFRSTLGFLIQIPVFIAAFNVLNEAAGLNGAQFLWIDDLAQTDQFLTLPFSIPFFGSHINLLPVLMTIVTLLGAWMNRDASLAEELLARRRRSLYWMAALFFVLFYTFPAGMVLYWTINVALQSIRDLVRQWRAQRLDAS